MQAACLERCCKQLAAAPVRRYYDASWLSFRDVYWRLGRQHAEDYDAADFFYAGRRARAAIAAVLQHPWQWLGCSAGCRCAS
jgi:hypothetical protein